MKVKISDEEGGEQPVMNAIEYKYPGAPKTPTAYPLVLTALAKNQYFPVRIELFRFLCLLLNIDTYFQIKEGVSLYKVVMGNPMILMMIFSFAVVLGFPMLMKNMV